MHRLPHVVTSPVASGLTIVDFYSWRVPMRYFSRQLEADTLLTCVGPSMILDKSKLVCSIELSKLIVPFGMASKLVMNYQMGPALRGFENPRLH